MYCHIQDPNTDYPEKVNMEIDQSNAGTTI